mmetsp:Transcript_1677/g.3645  ORF Transcript_1677/g.3645 Transcript_1677/m.3645 type:complete len:225 (+) Transcript_1677:117-791(+)
MAGLYCDFVELLFDSAVLRLAHAVRHRASPRVRLSRGCIAQVWRGNRQYERRVLRRRRRRDGSAEVPNAEGMYGALPGEAEDEAALQQHRRDVQACQHGDRGTHGEVGCQALKLAGGERLLAERAEREGESLVLRVEGVLLDAGRQGCGRLEPLWRSAVRSGHVHAACSKQPAEVSARLVERGERAGIERDGAPGGEVAGQLGLCPRRHVQREHEDDGGQRECG